jgi:hypothetical protein
MIMAGNGGLEFMPAPMRSRFVIVSVLNIPRADGRQCATGNPDPEILAEFVAEQQNMQALVAATFTFMHGGEFGGRGHNVIEVLYPRFEAQLRARGITITGNRVRMNAMALARVLTVVYANHMVFQCSENRMRAGTPFRMAHMLDLTPFLWVTTDIAVFVLGMMGSITYSRPDQYNILRAIGSMCFKNRGSQPRLGAATTTRTRCGTTRRGWWCAGLDTPMDTFVQNIMSELSTAQSLTVAPTQVRAVLSDLAAKVMPQASAEKLPRARTSLPDVTFNPPISGIPVSALDPWASYRSGNIRRDVFRARNRAGTRPTSRSTNAIWGATRLSR